MPQTVSSAYQALIRVSGYTALFNTYTGGNPQRPGTRWRNGGGEAQIVRDRLVWSDVTVTKGYEFDTDPEILFFLDRAILTAPENTVFVTPTRPDGSIAYKARQLRGEITEVQVPDFDTNGGTTVPTWGLTIMVAAVA